MTWLADIVLAALAAEAIVLIARKSLPSADVIGLLLPGAALAWALRQALDGDGMMPIGLSLLVALAGHVLDLRRRLARH